MHKKIVSTPDVIGGALRFDGTRISIKIVATYLSFGILPEEIIEDYPTLTVEDIEYCKKYLMLLN